jgi:alpha-galactosidase
MSARFGMDLDLNKLSAEDKAICAGAITAYKEIRDVTAFGDLYRVEDPHETFRGAINFVSPDQSRAVVFAFQMKDGAVTPVHPQGLDPAKKYTVHELNPAPGRAAIPQEGQTLTGDQIMHDGLTPSCAHAVEACVIELSS